jgi:hypothetical protein
MSHLVRLFSPLRHAAVSPELGTATDATAPGAARRHWPFERLAAEIVRAPQ